MRLHDKCEYDGLVSLIIGKPTQYQFMEMHDCSSCTFTK